MRQLFGALALVLAIAPRASAQSESALRAALEGKTVTVKVDMPGTAKGIDVFPEEPTPVNWRDVADRVKANGTALRIGQTAMITKVVVNKNSHIEVQLGGGGYGTFGDQLSGSSEVSSTDQSESKWERQLRDSIKAAPSGAKKKQFETELNNARSERERENARARAATTQANEAREANLRIKRIEGGSRFNLRYKHGIPAEVLTPAGLLAALAPYAEQAGGMGSAAAAQGANAAPGAKGALALRKGLLMSEVEALLGPANTAGETKEGTLTVMKRSYVSDGRKISTAFVNGVLIDFTIAPQ